MPSVEAERTADFCGPLSLVVCLLKDCANFFSSHCSCYNSIILQVIL